MLRKEVPMKVHRTLQKCQLMLYDSSHEPKLLMLEGVESQMAREHYSHHEPGDCARRAHREVDALRIWRFVTVDLFCELECRRELSKELRWDCCRRVGGLRPPHQR